jgi:hypothetical protein
MSQHARMSIPACIVRLNISAVIWISKVLRIINPINKTGRPHLPQNLRPRIVVSP